MMAIARNDYLPIEIYTKAIQLANKNNQTVGEKRDLYITIEQLEQIIKNASVQIG